MIGKTIAAIATPSGQGGIGIIKISGSQSVDIAKTLFWPSGSVPKSYRSHHLYHGYIVDPIDERKIDEVLLSVMSAPRTYTCEDIVEINAHSGSRVLREIFELVLKCGAQIADPGEFTKRAFLNGRIDLTQAEAVIDIITARTDKSLESATAQLRGEMGTQVNKIRDRMIQNLTEIEAAIDFPDDLEDEYNIKDFAKKLRNHGINPLTRILKIYNELHVYRDGARLMIVGRPNVGKSSLMNCLLEKERVIVTDIPGTTRDVVEDTMNIAGIPVVLADSAGLHNSSDPIELIGMSKTVEHVERCEQVLFMLDALEGVTHDDWEVYQKVAHLKPILVVNKIDLVGYDTSLKIPQHWDITETVYASVLNKTGIDAIKSAIQRRFKKEGEEDKGGIIPSLRHKIAFEKALENVKRAVNTLEQTGLFELIKIDLKDTIDALGSIVGVTADPDILDEIFSKFCIGK